MRAADIDSLDGLMARYVAGALPEPARVLVAAHLAIKPEKRVFIDALESMAGTSLEMSEPMALSNRDMRLNAIFSAGALPEARARTKTDGVLPGALRDFVGYDVDQIPWKTKMPGYREFPLGEIDGCEAAMLWIKAGRKMP